MSIEWILFIFENNYISPKVYVWVGGDRVLTILYAELYFEVLDILMIKAAD